MKINVNDSLLRYLVAFLIIFFFVFAVKEDDRNFEISKNLEIYYTLFKELNTYYVDEIDPAKLVKNSIDKMLADLDPYTVFIPESKMEDYKFMTTGQYGGIGASIKDTGDSLVISDLYEAFPAQKSGLKVGDVLLSIDSRSLIGLSSEEAGELVKGQPGTSILIRVRRPGHKNFIDFKIVREDVKIKSVPYYGKLTNEIGYINLSSFTENCADDFQSALLSLKADKINSLVIDLRGNPGGLLLQSVDIVNLFVPKDVEVVSTKGKYRQFDNSFKTRKEALDTEIPVVVIVNENSASASEIVSGAMQDLDRAVVIGSRTFGKGLVQTTRDIAYNTKLKLTTSKYYIPSGRCIQALDYSHRKNDGSVEKISDSLITAYKTKNGRTVFDGAGISPDIAVETEKYPLCIEELIKQNFIFDFATMYCIANQSIETPEKFEVNDDIFNSFKDYCIKRKFSYDNEIEKEIKNIEKLVTQKANYSSISEELKSLSTELLKIKSTELDENKKQILQLLKIEIVGRFYFQKGKIISQNKNDKSIIEAVKILSDSNLYNSILEGKSGMHKKSN